MRQLPGSESEQSAEVEIRQLSGLVNGELSGLVNGIRQLSGLVNGDPHSCRGLGSVGECGGVCTAARACLEAAPLSAGISPTTGGAFMRASI
eukprot:1501490-Prymnesium_polylepis.1